MTITNPQSYTKDTDQWVHGTFIVSLGADATGKPIDYNTYVQIVQNNQKDELYGNGITPTLESNMANIVNGATDGSGPLPVYYSHSKCRDTSLGGNDAINCYYQYNETDDPPHPFTMAETSASTGMGRVYSETIDDHQQILYMTFGIPVFNNLAGFYQDALDKQIADLTNTGTTTTLLKKLGAMASVVISTLGRIPSMPIVEIESILQRNINTTITKYYDFSNRMDLYYKYVQSILTHISINMGFMNDANLLQTNPASNGTGGVINDTTFLQQAQGAVANSGGDAGLPDMFKTFHMDILQIMQRRASFMQPLSGFTNTNANFTTDYAVQQMTLASNALKKRGKDTQTQYDISMLNPLEKLVSGFVSTTYNALLYVGFRIERSTDSSESISNQIGPSAISSFVNDKMQASRSAKFDAMYGRTGIGWLDSFSNMLGGLDNNQTEKIDNTKGFDGLTALATGSGMIDIPDVWKDSSVSKNYSFEMKLRSPYGDPLSIMQSLYVPMMLIMAAALPRAIGNASYTTPFICRAYCKGMFSVPLGMIENMTIRRGSDVNGWSYQRLPTSIDISFSIKDLSPCMYMAMGDLSNQDPLNPKSIWNSMFGNNSAFQEYLLTLSGMGIAERSLWVLNLKRKVKLGIQTVIDQRLNPYYWDALLGNTSFGKYISAIIPTTKLPQ